MTTYTPSDLERKKSYLDAAGYLDGLAASVELESPTQSRAYSELAKRLRDDSGRPKPPNFSDISGKKFGRLSVIRLAGTRPKDGRTMWFCRCDCGSVKEVTGKALRSGRTMSCGCAQIEVLSLRNRTHGLSESSEYSSWCKMKDRCLNPKSKDYKDYGGRGISVFSEWIISFQKFYLHIGAKPTSEHSLERINVNGNYEPGNVRWATEIEQQNNKRNNRRLVLKGVELTLSEWAREIGMNHGTLEDRLNNGWSVERALTTPTQHRE